jgi:hypothetical protein
MTNKSFRVAAYTIITGTPSTYATWIWDWRGKECIGGTICKWPSGKRNGRGSEEWRNASNGAIISNILNWF